jgi:hypothetical protein
MLHRSQLITTGKRKAHSSRLPTRLVLGSLPIALRGTAKFNVELSVLVFVVRFKHTKFTTDSFVLVHVCVRRNGLFCNQNYVII